MAARFPEGVEAESVCLDLANGSEHEALLRGGGEHIGVVQKNHGVIQSSSPESRLGRPDSEGLAPGTPHENEPSSDLRRDSSSASKLPFNPPEASYSGLLRPAGTVKNWGILRNMMATSPRNQMEPMEGWEGSAVVQAANAGGNGVAGGVATTPGGGGATVVHATNEMDASVVVEPEDKENLVESRGFDVRTEGGSLVREPSDVVLAGRSPMKAPEAHQNPQGPFAEANRLQGYDSVTNAAAETVAVVVQRMLNRDESPYRQAKSSDCEIEDSQVPGMWINDVWTRKDVEDLDSDIRSALTEEGIDPGEYFKRDYTDFPSVAHYYINLHDRLNDRMDEELIDLVASFSGRLGPTHPLVEAMKEVMAAQQQGEPCTRFSSGLLVDISMNLDDSGVLLVQNEGTAPPPPSIQDTENRCRGRKYDTFD